MAAQLLAADGATVAINYRDKMARAEKVKAAIEEKGGKAIVVGADLTDYSTIDALHDTLASEFGHLDILVLNASGGMEAGKAEGDERANRRVAVRIITPLLRQ